MIKYSQSISKHMYLNTANVFQIITQKYIKVHNILMDFKYYGTFNSAYLWKF